MKNDILFSEQQFWGPVAYLVVILVNLIVFFALLKAKTNKAGIPLKAWQMKLKWVFMSIFFLGSIYFMSFRLETQIKAEGIYVRFFPQQLSYKLYAFSDIKSIEVREYSPMAEFGGWGFKGSDENKAINASGNKGIQLIFNNGKKLLIGTNKEKEAGEALLKMNKLSNLKY